MPRVGEYWVINQYDTHDIRYVDKITAIRDDKVYYSKPFYNNEKESIGHHIDVYISMMMPLNAFHRRLYGLEE